MYYRKISSLHIVLILVLTTCLPHTSQAYINVIRDNIDKSLDHFVNGLHSVLFIKIFDIPFIVLWLVAGGIFFTLRFGFINFRLLPHALSVLFSKKYNFKTATGSISHFKAFSTAVAGTIGLGTISGVAIGVTIGGPGAVLWMALAGLIGMSNKFIEVLLGLKYRSELGNDKILGGPFQYIKHGFAKKGFANIGKFIAILYALLVILAGVFGSVPFQAHEVAVMMTGYSLWIDNNMWFIASIITLLAGLVIIGGINRIATVASTLVPIMALMYVFSCIVVIIYNISALPQAFSLMYSEMFDLKAASGGAMGALIAGVRRAVFANEAGIGTAAIAHSSTQDNNAVRAGLVAMLEPMFDTVIVCVLTGIVIVITGLYAHSHTATGILLTRDAFATVSTWFPIFLLFAACLFGFSTITSFSYYSEMGWCYLFTKCSKSNYSVWIYRILILLDIFFAANSQNFAAIATLGDTLFMCLAIPNMLALYILNNDVALDLKNYCKSLKKPNTANENHI